MPLEQAAACCAEDGFVWLGLFEPSPDELARVRRTFDLHQLAVQDSQTFHLRPKVEHFDGGGELVVVRTARYDEEREQVDTGEISVFLGGHFVITVRRGIASELHGARVRLETHPELLKVGTSSVLWAILDQIVDGYAPVVAELDRDIEQIEAAVFSGSVAPTERIYSLRREVSDFYRAVHPLLSVLTSQLQANKCHPELAPYFRDVHDHLVLVSDEVMAQRDLLATVLEANLAVISLRQNEITLRQSANTEQLTVFATVFLPLSFVVGFFGQNFDWLVSHIQSFSAFAVLGIGGLVLPCALLLFWFRHRARAPLAGEFTPAPLEPGRPT
jgi:magnesium transporter